MYAFVVLSSFFSIPSQEIGLENVSEITYFVLNGTSSSNLINQCIRSRKGRPSLEWQNCGKAHGRQINRWSLKLEAKDVLPNINRTQDAERAEKCRFLFLVTFYLDIQARPSEEPNTFSLWIWPKSVQRFPRYFIHKKPQTAPKTEPCAAHCVR